MSYDKKAQKKYAEKTMVFAIKYYPKERAMGELLANVIKNAGKSSNEWIKDCIKEKLIKDGYSLDNLDTFIEKTGENE